MTKTINQLISDLAEVGKCLWQKGWAERNAGNISVNVTESLPEAERKRILQLSPFPAGLERLYPGLKNAAFLVTGTGRRMRELASDPEANLMLIVINESGDAYFSNPLKNETTVIRPTSELPTHLAIHEQLVISGKAEKALLHTHPDELIALTQIREFCEEDALNHLLWGMHPETPVFIPEGAGFVSYLLPGTEEIAMATLEKFRNHRAVIWEKHGCLAIGEDVFEAFDLVDMLAKSAGIFFRCRAAGYTPEGLSEEQIRELKAISHRYL
jgi:rhamnulose-1-phosphate aldolase